MSAEAVDPWAVIEAVFPKAKPNPRPRPTALLGGEAGSGYGQAALAAEADAVARAPEGTRNHTLNKAAYNLGQLVAGGVLTEDDVTQALSDAAVTAGLTPLETARTIASGMGGGAAQPRGVPEQVDGDALSWIARAEEPAVDPQTGEILEDTRTPEEKAQAWHDRQVAHELTRLRIADDAKRAFAAERATLTFREPPSAFTLADELLIPDEPITYAIDELLPAGANALLAAQFKTGKTTLINNYARSFADGTPFLGRFTVNPADGRVAIFNYEVGRDQFRRWMRDMGIVNADRIVVLNLRGFRLPLSAPTVEDWVVDWLTERDVTAWVVDPFARASVGLDENSNGEVGVWLDTLDVIKERAGVRDLILPTHTGRAEQEVGQERARGATRLDDWADVRWLLTKDDSDHRFFRATGRDVEVAEELLQFEPDTRSLVIGGGDRRWVKGREAAQAVLDYVNANPGCGVKAIQNGVGGHRKHNLDSARLDLIRRHKIRVEDAPRGGQNHYANETQA